MNGLQLSKQYYFDTARGELLRFFPDLYPRLAAGLVGNGSECFGYDDEISRDHDWGVDFFLWLTDEDADRIDDLPKWKQTLFEKTPPPFVRNRSAYGAVINVMTAKPFTDSSSAVKAAPLLAGVGPGAGGESGHVRQRRSL